MKSSRKTKVLIVLSLLAIATATYFVLRPKNLIQDEKNKLAQTLANDEKILKNEKEASEREIYSALVRLGDHNNLLSKQEALKRMQNPSAVIRKGAAEALGFFLEDQDSKTALATLLADEDPIVRLAAINAHSRRGGNGKIEILEKLLAQKGPNNKIQWNDLEKANLYIGILRLAKGDAKASKLPPLLALYKSTKDVQTKNEILIHVMSQVPKNPSVLDLVENEALKSSEALIITQAIRHIAAIREKRLAEKLGDFLQSPHLPVRMALVQSLFMACPSNRIQILERTIEKDPQPEVRKQAIEQIAILGGDEANTLLERLTKNTQLNPDDLSLVQSTLKNWKKSEKNIDRCAL